MLKKIVLLVSVIWPSLLPLGGAETLYPASSYDFGDVEFFDYNNDGVKDVVYVDSTTGDLKVIPRHAFTRFDGGDDFLQTSNEHFLTDGAFTLAFEVRLDDYPTEQLEVFSNYNRSPVDTTVGGFHLYINTSNDMGLFVWGPNGSSSAYLNPKASLALDEFQKVVLTHDPSTDFDGIDDYYSSSDNAFVGGSTTAFTAAVEFKHESVSAGNTYSMMSNYRGGTDKKGWRLFLSDKNKLNLVMSGAVYVGPYVEPGVYHKAVVIYDGSGDWTLSVDGQNFSVSATNQSALEDFYIGRNADSSAGFYEGSLRAVEYYTGAVTNSNPSAEWTPGETSSLTGATLYFNVKNGEVDENAQSVSFTEGGAPTLRSKFNLSVGGTNHTALSSSSIVLGTPGNTFFCGKVDANGADDLRFEGDIKNVEYYLGSATNATPSSAWRPGSPNSLRGVQLIYRSPLGNGENDQGVIMNSVGSVEVVTE